MNIRVLKSPAKFRNPNLKELDRNVDEDNLTWVLRAMKASIPKSAKSQALLVLVGGNDPLSFRLRIAQAHVRHDLSPSAWSHALFVSTLAPKLGASRTLEISLMPGNGFGPFGFPLPSNGLQHGTLDTYRGQGVFPNIAVLSVPVSASLIAKSLEEMRFQRSTLDCPQLILKWLGYCWGVGVPSSPLADGFGIPASAILETAFSANGFDLTPGMESRSSCPEAIWQAANWWRDYYEKRAEGGSICGAFTAKHDLVPEARYSGLPNAPNQNGVAKPRK